MSILGSRSNNNANMGTPFFHEFKKQASFFFKEKIKSARLALTDVTPAQLLTEEATNSNPWAPDARTLKMISSAAFEIDDYWRIVEILHKRLTRFDRNNWRIAYKSLIVLDHLLTHGPESVAEEFQSDKDVIREMDSFQYIDEKGFNWGLNVRRKSERILKLLQEGPLLKEERNRARKLSRGIQGFGSFCQRTTSGVLHGSSYTAYGRSNSQFNDHGNQENQFPPKDKDPTETHDENVKKAENSYSWDCFSDQHANTIEKIGTRGSFKENMAPEEELFSRDMNKWSSTEGESKPLMDGQKEEDTKIANQAEEDHPFNDADHLTTVSFLSAGDRILQAC